MYPAALYSLLQISQSDDFIIGGKAQTNAIKRGVISYLKYESNDLYSQTNLDEQLNGWELLIREKCLRNELMDVKTINIPDLN